MNSKTLMSPQSLHGRSLCFLVTFEAAKNPTEECFSNAEGAATTFISSLQNYSGKTILPKPIFLCFMRSKHRRGIGHL